MRHKFKEILDLSIHFHYSVACDMKILIWLFSKIFPLGAALVVVDSSLYFRKYIARVGLIGQLGVSLQ
jgi:hypothetical protein